MMAAAVSDELAGAVAIEHAPRVRVNARSRIITGAILMADGGLTAQ